MRYVPFFVVDKSRLQEGAIISTTWLAKIWTLYYPQPKEPCTNKMEKSIDLTNTKENFNSSHTTISSSWNNIPKF